MPRISFDVFAVDVPEDWDDITDSIEGENPPFTLARGDGVGALQFSGALYEGGVVPDPSIDDLLHMLDEFAETRDLGPPFSVVTESTLLRLAAASFVQSDWFVRAWQVSDGRNFAFVTYTCEPGHEALEVADCERIVRSLRFDRSS